MHTPKLPTFLSCVLALSMLLSPSLRAQTINLPEIGQSGAALVTPTDERKTGESVVRNIRRAGAMLDDPLLNDYINNLGYLLVSASNNSLWQFQFFLVNDGSINAFALPGGFIGVNYGLITATDTESELASVIAHEIAHVTQRHHARSYEFASNNTIPQIAAMIAAIILGTQDAQLGTAALASVQANQMQQQLDFTRENEKEADYLGIQLLADSGFNPYDMAVFFNKLDKESRLYGGAAVPEFLRTHPVNQSRIADATNRASQQPVKKSIYSPKNYYLMRARLKVLSDHHPEQLLVDIRKRLKQGRYQDQDAINYALALTYIELKKYPKARKILSRLLAKDPGRIAYLVERARLESLAGDHPQALALFEAALNDYPGNNPLTYYYALALIDAKKFLRARNILLQQLKKEKTNPNLFQLLARTEAALGNTTGTHVALGEYYYQLGLTHDGLKQLQLALKSEHLDFYNMSRIEARIADFQEEMAQLSALQQ